MMKQRIGILGGSFNPIHIGHLALANYLCEFEGLDELWFMLSPHNPLKEIKSLLSDEKRLELLRLAVKDYTKFRASDFEFSLPRPSYTVNTLEKLRATYPEKEFMLIIGADNWNIFSQWKDYERIIDTTQILVYPRPGIEVEECSLPSTVRLVHSPQMEISSSFVRSAIGHGKDIRCFLPPEVYDKIREENLYGYNSFLPK
ncbi:MAG: nicotinate (nicotinamide) nucleotide adenylyltransferase [Bacteroides sp.]